MNKSIISGATYLIHYASEHYEEHKKSKDKIHTSGLNDKVKEVVKHVKDQTTSEKKIEESRSTRDSKISNTNKIVKTEIESKSSMKSQIEQHKAQMQHSINAIKETIKNMSPQEKAAKKEALYQQIDRLRERNATVRANMLEHIKSNYKEGGKIQNGKV